MPELEIISKKYPNAIITLNSAFYYYGLTDTIPNFYYVATPKNTRKISDERVKQFYENSEAFDMGKTTMNYDGVDIVIYDKERLLVELIRNKKRFMKSFIEEVNIYEAEQDDGRILRSLKFRFPVFFNDQELYELDWDNESTVESVALLVKGALSVRHYKQQSEF